MISVTDPAKRLIEALDRPSDGVLRLEPTDDAGLGFVMGDPMDGDQIVESRGQDVLHIDGMLSHALDGAVLDAMETEEGMSLTLEPAAGGNGTGPA